MKIDDVKKRYNSIWEWYNNYDVKKQIINQLINRECAILIPKIETHIEKNSRNFRCHTTKNYDFIFEALKLNRDKIFFQMYYSLAKFKTGVPFHILNFKKRKPFMIDWNNRAEKEIDSYLILVDIDAKSHDEIDEVFEQAKKVKDFLDLDKPFNYEYSIIFSGMGFHFVIQPNEYVGGLNDIDIPGNTFDSTHLSNEYKYIKSWVKHYIQPIAPNIDMSIYDSRRLAKLPYSLAIYNDATYVCYPFSSTDEFLNFKLKDYNLINFNKSIFEKGVYIFNGRKR